MSLQRFVIDTNVLVAGLIAADTSSSTARVVDAMLTGEVIFLLSPALLREYRAVLLRSRLARLHRLTEEEIDHLLAEIVANALWREPAAAAPQVPPDPGDGHMWALLASEPGAALVTGERALLANPPPGHPVLIAADCVHWLAHKRASKVSPSSATVRRRS